MKPTVCLSACFIDLLKYVEGPQFIVELIESPLRVVQLKTADAPIHFVFETTASPTLSAYLKENTGQKMIVQLKSLPVPNDLAVLLRQFEVEYLEISGFAEFKELLEAVVDELSGRDEEEVVMVQRKEENFKGNELWIKFLSCIPGISAVKAEAISKVYPNFTALLIGYSRVEESKREEMLKDIPTGAVNVGKIASKKIYRYINAESANEVL
jgi:hypothetical protein